MALSIAISWPQLLSFLTLWGLFSIIFWKRFRPGPQGWRIWAAGLLWSAVLALAVTALIVMPLINP